MNLKLYLMTATLWLGGINNLTASAITPLMEAAGDGNLVKVEQLAAQENIEAIDMVLHLAVSEGHAKAIEVLLEQGANIEAANNEGETTLHLAAFYGHTKVTEELLSKGAKIDNPNKWGNTALHFAALEGHAKVIEVLLEQGANIEAENNEEGNTALHYAAFYGHEEAIEVLLEQGANIEAANDQGNTPLHFAAFNGHEEAVEKLLRWKADIEAKNTQGETALTVGNGRMAAFIKNFLKKIEEESNLQEIDMTNTKVEENENGVGQQVAVVEFMTKTKKQENKAMLLKINAKTDDDLIKCSQKIGLTKTALINLAIFEFLEKTK